MARKNETKTSEKKAKILRRYGEIQAEINPKYKKHISRNYIFETIAEEMTMTVKRVKELHNEGIKDGTVYGHYID